MLSLGCSHPLDDEEDSKALSQLSHLRPLKQCCGTCLFVMCGGGRRVLLSTLENSATDTRGEVDKAQAWSHAIGACFLRFDPIVPFNVSRESSSFSIWPPECTHNLDNASSLVWL